MRKHHTWQVSKLGQKQRLENNSKASSLLSRNENKGTGIRDRVNLLTNTILKLIIILLHPKRIMTLTSTRWKNTK